MEATILHLKERSFRRFSHLSNFLGVQETDAPSRVRRLHREIKYHNRVNSDSFFRKKKIGKIASYDTLFFLPYFIGAPNVRWLFFRYE